MLLNYLLCAYKVLLRRKLFTFISLFAVSLTLAVLLVILTIIDNFIFPTGAEKHSQHFITIDFLRIWDQPMVRSKSGYLGHRFYQDNISRLKIPEKISIYSKPNRVTHYLANGKITSKLRYTDLNYWQILDFEFIDGKGFSQQAFDAKANQMIISKATAEHFFNQQNPIGQTIEINLQTYQVIGVVNNVSNLELEARGDMWVMNSTFDFSRLGSGLLGNWVVMLYHSNPDKLSEISDEYQQLLANDPILFNSGNYIIAKSYTNNHLDKLVRHLTDNNQMNSGANSFIFYLIALMLGFMLLPAINLINLNISRVIERTEEIGVRKSFGASSNQLIIQFLIENLILTTLGAIIGFILSIFILHALQAMPFMPYIVLSLSFNCLFYVISIVLIFSLLSGVYPAWKMSKLHPINALKGNF